MPDLSPAPPATPWRLGTELTTDAPVDFGEDERKKHTHIIGASGTGKSFCMLQMILRDIADRGCGVAVLDPHGSLYDLIVHQFAHAEPELAERVILFDPSGETDYVLGFNPLGDAAQLSPDAAINLMVLSCLKAWGQHSTDHSPRIARTLRNIFAVLVANGLTLVEAVCLIDTSQHNPHRRRLLAALTDEHILSDWLEFEKTTNTYRNQFLEGAQNRLHRFLSNKRLTSIFGQQHTVLSPQRVIEEKKVLLVNLRPSIHIDEESNRLLGVLLINEFYRVALLRQPEPFGKPHPFYCYVDECYHFITRDLARSLDGTRKFGLFFRLAHQHMAQLEEEDEQLGQSILTNCRAKVVFGGLTYQDADLLARQIYTDADATLSVKHVNRQTAFRPVEVPDIRHTFSLSHSESEQLTASRGTGRSVALSHSEAEARSDSHTETRGETHQQNNSRSVSAGAARARQRGGSTARGETQGETTGLSLQQGSSVSDGDSSSASNSESRQLSSGQTASSQEGQSYTLSAAGELPLSVSRSAGRGRAVSASESTGESQAFTSGHSHNETSSENLGLQASRQTAVTQTRTVSGSETETASLNVGAAQGESRGNQYSVSDGTTASTTTTEGVSVTESSQESRSRGEGHSDSAGLSVAVGVRHRMDEYQEETPVFWTLQEVRHRQVCGLIDLPQATAVIRVENGPVRLTRIAHVPLHPYDGEYSPWHAACFRRDVIEEHPDCYLAWEEARRQIEARQLAVFQTTFSLGLTVSRPGGTPAEPPAPAGDDTEPTGYSPAADAEVPVPTGPATSPAEPAADTGAETANTGKPAERSIFNQGTTP